MIGTGGIISTGGAIGTGGVVSTGARSAPVASSAPAAWWAAVARAAVAAAGPSALAACRQRRLNRLRLPHEPDLPAWDHHLRLLAERQRRLFRHRLRLRYEHLPADGGLPRRLSDWLLLRHEHLLQAGGDWLRWFSVHRNGPDHRDRGGPDLPRELAVAWSEGDPDRAPGRRRDRVCAVLDLAGPGSDRTSPADHPPAGDRDRHRLLRHAGHRLLRDDHLALQARAASSPTRTSPAR